MDVSQTEATATVWDVLRADPFLFTWLNIQKQSSRTGCVASVLAEFDIECNLWIICFLQWKITPNLLLFVVLASGSGVRCKIAGKIIKVAEVKDYRLDVVCRMMSMNTWVRVKANLLRQFYDILTNSITSISLWNTISPQRSQGCFAKHWLLHVSVVTHNVVYSVTFEHNLHS